MKTCAACGRPLASHGGKAAIQSSEIGPKAGDAPCCAPQGGLPTDGPKGAQGKTSGIKPPVSKPKGTKRQGAKQRIRALREFARKKLGHFLPARITLRSRPKVEQAASEAVRPRRPTKRPLRTRKRLAKSEHVVSTPPEKAHPASPSETATRAMEQSPKLPPSQAQPEKRTEEAGHVVLEPSEKLETPSLSEAVTDLPKYPLQTVRAEAQMEMQLQESEHGISVPSEKIKSFFPNKSASEVAEQQTPQPQSAEVQLEIRFQEREHVISKQEKGPTPSETDTDAAEKSLQMLPGGEWLERSKEESATDTTLSETEDLALVPWRADEPLDVTQPAPETPGLEEQVKTLPAQAAEVCNPEEPQTKESTAACAQSSGEFIEGKPAENSALNETPAKEPESKAYAMIPPAPSAPVPGRAEFEAKLQIATNPQSKEALFGEEPIELVSGLSADRAAQCGPPPREPLEPAAVTPKAEEAVEEIKSASTPAPTNELSVPEMTNPIERETAGHRSMKTEDCLPQALVPEAEGETASDQSRIDQEANENLQPPAKKKVLVVDDDPTLRMLLRMGLEPHGYECLLAEHGKAAQAVVQANHPAVILVDLLMPVMDGLAFVQWLRGTANDSTPVLVFTNLDDAKITQQALDSGANAFACKPLRLKELLHTIKELVPV